MFPSPIKPVLPGAAMLPSEMREASLAMERFTEALCRAFPALEGQIRSGVTIQVALDNGTALKARVVNGAVLPGIR